MFRQLYNPSHINQQASVTDHEELILPRPPYSASKLMIIPCYHCAQFWSYVYMSVAGAEIVYNGICIAMTP